MEKTRMATQEVGNSSEVEVDDSCIMDSSQLPWNILAMLALKTTFGGKIADFRMWRERMDETLKQPIDYVIFTGRRHGVGKDSHRWACLVAQPQNQGMQSETKSTNFNQDQCHELVDCFKIYRRLMRDQEQVINFGSVEEVILYSNNSRSINPSQIMVKESEEKDFIFGSKLLKLKNDFEGRKKLLDEVLEKCDSKKEEKFLGEYSMECSQDLLVPDIQSFFEKIAFVTDCPDWKALEASAKAVIKQCTDAMDPDGVLKRLMATMGNLWENKEVQKFIKYFELKNLFKDVLTGRREKVVLRFNMSGPVSDFVGRVSPLSKMTLILQGNTRPLKIGSTRKLVLCGLGGMGKSELAREYCKSLFISHYDVVAWINAENDEVIGDCFKSLAFKELKLECMTVSGKLKDIFTVIKDTTDLLKSRRTLFIYDNAESLPKIKKYLPSDAVDDHIHIIITSRFQDWKDIPLILLDSFHPDEALVMVKRSLGHLPCWNENDGQALCKALGYHPLGLKQAVSYIHEQSLKKGDMAGESLHISEYLHLLRDSSELVLDHSLSQDEGSCSETTFKKIMNTFEYLKKTLSGQVAVTVLNIASYLSPDCIDIARMSSAGSKYSAEVVGSSFTLLAKLSLVSIDGSKARIHRLIQHVNRIRLRNLGLEVGVLRTAMTIALEMGNEHIINVWECSSKYPDLVKEFSAVACDLCDVLVINGNCDTFLSFSELALPLLKTHIGTYSQEVMKIEVYTAQTYMALGQYANAEKHLKKFIFKWQKTSMNNKDEYYLGKFLYGCVLEFLDRVDESLTVFKEISSEEEMVSQVNAMCFSLSAMKVTSIMLNKGVKDGEELDRLEQSSRKAYENIRAQVETVGLGPGWDVSLSMQVNLKKFSEQLRVGFRGVSYQDILMVYLCYQQLPMTSGKWEEAYNISKWCLDILSKHNQPSPLVVRNGKLQLAEMLMKLENRDFALKELIWLSSELGAGDDEDTHLMINLMLGQVYCLQGKFEEGIPKLLDLCFNESHDGFHHTGMCHVLFSLKDMCDSGNFDAVSRIAEKLFFEMEKCVGKDGMPLFFLENYLNFCYKLYKEGSRKVVAMNLLKHVYQSLRLRFGGKHSLTLNAKVMFARFYCWFGKKRSFEMGVSYLLEAEEILSQMVTDGDPLAVALLEQVQKDISVCKLSSQAKPVNYKKFSVLPLGGCSVKCGKEKN